MPGTVLAADRPQDDRQPMAANLQRKPHKAAIVTHCGSCRDGMEDTAGHAGAPFYLSLLLDNLTPEEKQFRGSLTWLVHPNHKVLLDVGAQASYKNQGISIPGDITWTYALKKKFM